MSDKADVVSAYPKPPPYFTLYGIYFILLKIEDGPESGFEPPKPPTESYDMFGERYLSEVL